MKDFADLQARVAETRRDLETRLAGLAALEQWLAAHPGADPPSEAGTLFADAGSAGLPPPETLATLLASSHDAIIGADPAGRILLWNPAAAHLFGYAAAEVLGRPVSLLDPPEAPTPAPPDGPVTFPPLALLARGGHRRHVALTIAPLPGGGALYLAKDLTERDEMEDRLRQSHKMEAIGQLAGGIAHDFNNLLTVITGYAIRATDELAPAHPAFASVVQIGEAGRRAAALTRQLLAFSRKQVLLPRVLDLNELLDAMTPMLSRLIRESLAFDVELEPGLPAIEADPHQIEQVVLNLVINASDAMPSGGRLLLKTTAETVAPADPRTALDLAPGAYAVLSVADTGVGIPASHLTRIFEPFFTTKEPGKGTGLGLATVHGVVKQSGGHVTVDSRPGAGTTFRVYLPASDAPAEHPAPAMVPAAFAGSGNILVVEDDPQLREYIAAVLTDLGYAVLTAGHPEQARAAALSSPVPLSLLITDLILPQGHGRDLGLWLAERFPLVRTLYISGYPEQSALRDGRLDPGAEFLAKPFSPHDLGKKVREILTAPGRARHVLLVDDDRALLELFARALEEAGLLVSRAGDGLEAVDLASRLAVDIVVTDVVMPGREGLETIRHFHRVLPGVPVIAMSGHPEYLDLASHLGADAVLEKPFSRADLVSTVRALLPA